MRMYGKKAIRDKTTAALRVKEESRDAILWDITPAQRVCRIKIQGSNKLIICRYPDNAYETPPWMKPGQAVKVQHTRGARHRYEIVGPGQTIPTPVAGGGSVEIPARSDGILTGMAIRAYNDNPVMFVYIAAGTYIISGGVYSTSDITMEAASALTMEADSQITMGQYVVAIPAAPSTGYVRYDLLVVGTNGVVDVVSGTAVTSNPVIPSTPANHVVIGTILMRGDTAGITSDMINKAWETPKLVSIASDQTDFITMDWLDTYVEFTITMYDQNAVAITGNHTINLSFDSGNGSFTSDPADTTYSMSTAGSAITVKYYRFNEVTDVSPVIRVVHDNNYNLISLVPIVLFDSSGDPMV